MITPQLAAEASYDDNIYSTHKSRVDDLILRARPRLAITRPDPNFTASFAGEYEATRYLSKMSENTDSYAFKGDMRATVRRDTIFTLRLLQAREAEARSNPDSEAGIERPNRFDISEAYGEAVHSFNKLRLRGTIDYERRDYATRIGPVPARDSMGYELALGSSFEVGHLMRASLRLGYLDQNYQDPLFADVSGALVRGELAYFVTPLVTLTAKVDRSVVDSGLSGSAGYLRTAYSLKADYELLRNLILGAELGQEHRRYNGIERGDDGFTGRLAASYLISPRWALRADLRHRRQDSSGTAAGRDFGGNQVTIGAVFKGL
jgi:hypothetical protein